MRTDISSLPIELVYDIVDRLDYESELNALSQVNHQLHGILNPLLYHLDPTCCEESTKSRPLRGCATYALQWAITNGVEATARKALAAGVKPTAYLVGHAAREGRDNLVRLLYCYGQNVDLDVDARHHTIHEHGPGCFRKNASYPASPQVTPLGEAARGGHDSTVRLLLSHGANINGTLVSGARGSWTPLLLAVDSGHLTTVKLLVDAGTDKDLYDSGMRHAARKGHAHVARFLIQRGADTNYRDPQNDHNNPLLEAALRGYDDAVCCLLHYDTSQDDLSYAIKALDAAAYSRRKEVVELITQHFDLPRAAKTQDDQTAVACAAAACGLTRLLETTIMQGWDVRSPPRFVYDRVATPLSLASEEGHVPIVQLLLSLGADPDGGNIHDDNGQEEPETRRPLVEATRGGYGEIVSELLDHGAEIARDLEFDIILQEAVPHEHVFRLLVEKGQALYHRPWDEICDTMKAAVVDGQAAVVQMLIDSGKDFSDSSLIAPGTRLMELLAFSNKEILSIFLQNGYAPQPGIANEDSIVLCAVDHANVPLLQYLKSCGFSKLQAPSPEWQALVVRRGIKPQAHKRLVSIEELLDFLLREGFDINAVDDLGESPLFDLMQRHFAEDTVRIMIERGANPCLRNERGECPLIAALKKPCQKDRNTWTNIRFIDSEVFEILLQGAERQGIPWDVIEPQLEEAIALAGQRESCKKALKVMRKWYWRRKYPAPS